MSLKATSLLVQAAPLPTTFKGTPNDLFAAMIARMEVVSPNGANFIFIGDVAPSSNVGPWLRNGTQWWVWSNTQNTYVPQDLSASLTVPFAIGNAQPVSTSPPVWLQTTNNSTDVNPNGFGTPIGWFFWNGSTWQPFNSLVFSGPTASRPPSPANLQQFYDSDISALIWWERGAWRTVDGIPGDVKFVTSQTLAAALTQNPGWDFYGRTATDVRGRVLVMATQDPGGSPAAVFPPGSGVNPQPQGAEFGETTKIQLQAASATTIPPQIALWCLVKL
jgi:hypothetical protein